MLKYLVSTQLGVESALERLTSRVRGHRGAGLLEYALVALISVMVFGLIWVLFDKQISSLVGRIEKAISGTSGNTGL